MEHKWKKLPWLFPQQISPTTAVGGRSELHLFGAPQTYGGMDISTS
jgi:hypothetical protein